MRRSALTAIVITLGLAVSACGGDKKPGGSGADTAADRARARRLVLTATDMPAGWTGTQPTPDPEADAQGKALAACAGAVDPDVAESASVEGQDFEKDTASVSSEVTFVKTPDQARTDLAAITSSKFEPCAEKFAGDALRGELEGSGAALESVTFDPIAIDKYGDATQAFRMTATVVAGDQRLSIYLDLIFILKGRAEITVSFTEVGKPFDDTLKTSLLAKMGTKLAAA